MTAKLSGRNCPHLLFLQEWTTVMLMVLSWTTTIAMHWSPSLILFSSCFGFGFPVLPSLSVHRILLCFYSRYEISLLLNIIATCQHAIAGSGKSFGFGFAALPSLSALNLCVFSLLLQCALSHLQAIQGGRGWLAFGERNKIHSSFRRACICKFLRQKIVCYD